LLGLNLPGSAYAASSAATPADGLPDYAPVPAGAFGPAVNQAGYFVGHIGGNLYWVTDGFYQAMFLTTTEGVVMVDAPPDRRWPAVSCETHASDGSATPP
jgi:hypothetical protein